MHLVYPPLSHLLVTCIYCPKFSVACTPTLRRLDHRSQGVWAWLFVLTRSLVAQGMCRGDTQMDSGERQVESEAAVLVNRELKYQSNSPRVQLISECGELGRGLHCHMHPRPERTGPDCTCDITTPHPCYLQPCLTQQIHRIPSYNIFAWLGRFLSLFVSPSIPAIPSSHAILWSKWGGYIKVMLNAHSQWSLYVEAPLALCSLSFSRWH